MEVQSEAIRRRTCATYAGDMHALELHMLEAFERQLAITKEGFRDAHTLVLTLIATSKRHAQLLNDLVSSLGDVEKIVTDKLKSAFAGLFGIAAGLVDLARPLAVSKAMRDNYTALNHAIVGYVMLSTTASSLKNDETKFIANEFLNDYLNLAQQLIAIIPSLALRDLADTGIQVLDFNAAQQFAADKQWACLFSRELTTQTQATTQATAKTTEVQKGVTIIEANIAENLVAPNKIVVEKRTVENAFSAVGHVDAPLVETIVKPVIVEETFRPEKIVEVQPVIHREVRAPEIHHIERHIYEKVEAVGPHIVTNKPLVEEVIKPIIVEEVQEIIHRELPAPFVEKVEQHVSEVEVMPTLHTKEVIMEKEAVVEADLIVENVAVPAAAVLTETELKTKAKAADLSTKAKETEVEIKTTKTIETTTTTTAAPGLSAGAPIGLADALPKKL